MEALQFKCKNCGYEWYPRTAQPYKCPRCQHPLNPKRKQKEKLEATTPAAKQKAVASDKTAPLRKRRYRRINTNSAVANKRFAFDVNLTTQKTRQCKDCASWSGVCKRGKTRIAADQACQNFEDRIASRWYV